MVAPTGIDPHLLNRMYDTGSSYRAVGDDLASSDNYSSLIEPLFDNDGSVTFQPEEGLMPTEVGIMYMVLSSSIVLAFIIFSCLCAGRIMGLTSEDGGSPEFFAQEVLKLLALRKNVLQLQVQLAGVVNGTNLDNKNMPPSSQADNGRPLETVLCEHSSGGVVTTEPQPAKEVLVVNVNERQHRHRSQQGGNFREQSGKKSKQLNIEQSPLRQLSFAENEAELVVDNPHYHQSGCMLNDGDIIHPVNYMRQSNRSLHKTCDTQQPSSAKSSPRMTRKQLPTIPNSPVFRATLCATEQSWQTRPLMSDSAEMTGTSSLNRRPACGVISSETRRGPCCSEAQASNSMSLPRTIPPDYWPQQNFHQFAVDSNEDVEVQLKPLQREINRQVAMSKSKHSTAPGERRREKRHQHMTVQATANNQFPTCVCAETLI